VLPDGTKLVTCVAEEILLTDVVEGIEICRFAGVSYHIWVQVICT
jgi:hypothetical protein